MANKTKTLHQIGTFESERLTTLNNLNVYDKPPSENITLNNEVSKIFSNNSTVLEDVKRLISSVLQLQNL
jgi:hypothetical protein